MQKTKRRYASLIETIIAMALTVILTSTMLKIYSNISRNNHRLSQQAEIAFSEQIAQYRITKSMQEASLKISPSDKNLSADDILHAFYISHERTAHISSDSLVFTFNNRSDIDPEFCNAVLARIFIDNQKNLVLAYWPQPIIGRPIEYDNYRYEVLLQNVKDICIRLYSAPSKEHISRHINPKERGDISETITAQPNYWYSSQDNIYGDLVEDWDSGRFKTLPALLKLHITMENEEEIVLSTPIGNSNQLAKISYYLEN